MSNSSNFVEVASCEVAGVPVKKYKSERTGLVACLAQVEGPMVNGFLCLGEGLSSEIAARIA